MSLNRAALIRARVAKRPANTGGTSAPRAAARGGPRIGLGSAQRPYTQRVGLGPAQPVGPAAPATGAAASAAAGPTSMPWDAQYNSSVGGADQRYADKMAYLGSQRVLAQQGYGIDVGFNDYANNPYSRAALLRKSYDTAVRGSNTSYAARGQLYAGSLRNAQNANRSGYDQSYDSLNRDYLAALGDIDREKTSAKEDRERAIEEAGWQRLQGAQNEPLEPQTAPASAGRGHRPKNKQSVNQRVKQRIGQGRRAR